MFPRPLRFPTFQKDEDQMGFFANMKNKFNSNMRVGGSYGMDEFGMFMMGLAFALLVLDMFMGTFLLSVLSLLVLMVAIGRSFSKGNYMKRQAENQMFLARTKPIRDWWKLLNMKYRDRKTMKYFKCERCGHVMRVPKGKGTIKVTCPHCETVVIKHT